MNINCEHLSPYNTPVVISKKGMSPSGDLTMVHRESILV